VLNAGAAALLWKPINHDDIRKNIEAFARVRPDARGARANGSAATQVGFAASWARKMEAFLRHVGASDIPVLLQGETGVGKEVLARQLHSLSPRLKKPFLKVNCAALPSELIESELFGYDRGAFTGAFKNNPGKFELANGGTILLDEIGDMDFKLQAKLLQVLQDREFLRLGASEPVRVDVRVMAATHCDLELAIEEGRFREDLYYRLNIIAIRVPPLRDRREEILDLGRFFLQKHATVNEPLVEIPPELRDSMLAHDWPGNVRELENVMRKLLVLRRPDLVSEDLRNGTRRRHVTVSAAAAGADRAGTSRTRAVSELWRDPVEEARTMDRTSWDPAVRKAVVESIAERDAVAPSAEAPYAAAAAANGRTIGIDEARESASILERVDAARREAETEAILEALNSTLWNRKRAAEILNIDYKALLYKMKKLGIAERASRAVAI
jgi:two-component system, NtrC family, response regulator AtoC